MEEIWKEVANTSGRYLVSSLGNVKRLKNGEYMSIQGSPDTYGYLYLSIKYDGCQKVKRVAIHRLVAQAFLSNPYNLPIVHHIDDNKTNNNVNNLFWCTIGQNQSFFLSSKGGRKPSYREIEQYDLNGNYIKTWNSFRDICDELKLDNKKCSTMISKCCRGTNGRKTAYGYIWKYGEKDIMYSSKSGVPNSEVEELFHKAYALEPEKVKSLLDEIVKKSNACIPEND